MPARPPRLIGRRAELESISQSLTGTAATVLIEGEAGVGKSRLLREALHTPAVQARGPLVAMCPPFKEALTLQPVVDAVRQARTGPAGIEFTALAGVLRPLFPEWAHELPPDPGPLGDPGAARHRLFRALGELLEGLGIEILVIEDLHWADDATLGFLLFLAAEQTRRISLVLTYRPEEVPAGSALRSLAARSTAGAGHVRVRLAPLSVSQSAELISSMLDDEHVSDAFARLLHQRTEGLPLALEESVRLLGDRRDLVRSHGEWGRRALEEISVPPTIRDAVLERFARQPPDVRQVVRAAAVLTEPAEESLIAHISGLPAPRAMAAAAAALRSGTLIEQAPGRMGFRHILSARAVHDDIPLHTRRALHLRAAQALEQTRPAPLARLAHHFREAGARDRWCHYAERAGDLALASGDYQNAVAMMQILLAEGELPTEGVVRWCQKFPVFACTGYLGGTDLIRTLRSLIDDAALDIVERGRIRLQLGRMLVLTGQYGTGAAELERGISELADRPLEAVGAMSALAQPSAPWLPVAEQRDWLDRVTELARTVLPSEYRLRMLIDRVTAMLGMGDAAGWKVARQIPAAVSSLRDAVELARADLNIGDEAIRWGHYGEARQRLIISHRAAVERGFLRMRDLATATLIHLDWHTGAWEGLAERAAAAAADAGDEPLIQLDTSLVIGHVTAAAGDLDGAADRLMDVLVDSRTRGLFDISLEAAAALARVRLAQGHLDEAMRVTEEGWHAVLRKGVWLAAADIAPIRVQVLVAAGQQADAVELVAAFARGARRCTAPLLKASLATCRAHMIDASRKPARAAAAWAAAATAWETLPRPYAELLAREAQARCLAAAGEGDGAHALLVATRDGLCELGARHDADRLVGALNSAGRKSGSRNGRRGPLGYGDQLSPRELEVVRLLLVGLSNPEIARTLARSPKTVAVQLKSAMRKHGVASRTALAVSVIQAGIEPAVPAEETL